MQYAGIKSCRNIVDALRHWNRSDIAEWFDNISTQKYDIHTNLHTIYFFHGLFMEIVLEYFRATTKCWIIEAAYPSHRVKLETVDFKLEPEFYCTNDYLEIKQGNIILFTLFD